MSGRCYTHGQSRLETERRGPRGSITELRNAMRERKHCRFCGGGMAGGEEGLLRHEENCLMRPGAT